MSCTGTTNWSDAVDVLWTAVQNREFVDAFTCTYANATQGLIVLGTLTWFSVMAMTYIRTGGSLAMPVVLTLLLGGAALTQVVAPVLGFAAIILLGGFALLIVLIARRLDRP